MISIYALVDPITKEVRYIGQTKRTIEKRLRCHILESEKGGRSKKNTWIKSLLNKNLKPEVFLLDIVKEENWEFWEVFYISLYKSWGFNLTNHTEGGDAFNYLKDLEEKRQLKRKLLIEEKGYYHSKETREKISKINLERQKNGFINPMKGKKYFDVLVAKYGEEGAKKKIEEINEKKRLNYQKLSLEEKKIRKEKEKKTKEKNGNKYVLTEKGKEAIKNKKKPITSWNKGITGYKVNITRETRKSRLIKSFKGKGISDWWCIKLKKNLAIGVKLKNKITNEEVEILEIIETIDKCNRRAELYVLSNNKKLIFSEFSKDYFYYKEFNEAIEFMLDEFEKRITQKNIIYSDL